jgi:outer membrane protein TolC
VQSAYAVAKAGAAGVDAARAEFMPKLFASSTVSSARGALGVSSLPSLGDLGSPILNLSNRTTSGVIMGGISVPIYDGGVRAAMLEQAKSRADSASATLIRTRTEAARQIVKADNALKTSLTTYEASQQLAAAAATTFDAALTAYRSGFGSVTEMTLAQSGLLDAQVSAIDAYHAALISAASLAFATGAVATALP